MQIEFQKIIDVAVAQLSEQLSEQLSDEHVWLRPSRIHPAGVYAYTTGKVVSTQHSTLREAVYQALRESDRVEWFVFRGRVRPFLKVRGEPGTAIPSECEKADKAGVLDEEAPDAKLAIVNFYKWMAENKAQQTDDNGDDAA